MGELFELRRSDVDTTSWTIRVRRGVAFVPGSIVAKDAKREAGNETSPSPNTDPLVRDHLHQHTQRGANGLMFPSSRGEYLRASAIGRWYYPGPPGRRTTGPALPRPAPHRPRPRRTVRRDPRRAEAPPWLHHTRRRDALPTCRGRAGPGDRATHVAALQGLPCRPTVEADLADARVSQDADGPESAEGVGHHRTGGPSGLTVCRSPPVEMGHRRRP